MAERAAGRALIRDAERILQEPVIPEPPIADEEAVARRLAQVTPEERAAVLSGMEFNIACACAGGPPGCTLCFCQIREKAYDIIRNDQAGLTEQHECDQERLVVRVDDAGAPDHEVCPVCGKVWSR